MKNIKVDFFSESKKWPRRVPKIKIITKKTIKKMKREEIKILGLFGINNPYTI